MPIEPKWSTTVWRFAAALPKRGIQTQQENILRTLLFDPNKHAHIENDEHWHARR